MEIWIINNIGCIQAYGSYNLRQWEDDSDDALGEYGHSVRRL